MQTRLSRKLDGLSFGPLWSSLGKIVLASALMGAVVWGGARLIALLPLTGKTHDLVLVAGLIPAAAATYGALLWLLKIEGRAELEALITKFRAKLKRA